MSGDVADESTAASAAASFSEQQPNVEDVGTAGGEALSNMRDSMIRELQELIHQIEEHAVEINQETGSLGADADIASSRQRVNQAISSAKAAAATAKPKLQGLATDSSEGGHPLMAPKGRENQELSEAIVFALKQLEDASKGFEAAVVAHSKRTSMASAGSLEMGNPASDAAVYHETSTRMASVASTVISSARRSPFGAAVDPEAQERRASGRERLLGNPHAERRVQRRTLIIVGCICSAIAGFAVIHHRASIG
mmetsp:Transcript_84/g.234  ORF Transcript_84/g.234 Transcript_84/m.234 type:complete len:254 (-) Transcript_84:207-968(-)